MIGPKSFCKPKSASYPRMAPPLMSPRVSPSLHPSRHLSALGGAPPTPTRRAGSGAEEANFFHALELEEHLLAGSSFASGDADTRKCFDQL
eukprot:11175673-Lingulodinium_polyedra.AAC.1